MSSKFLILLVTQKICIELKESWTQLDYNELASIQYGKEHITKSLIINNLSQLRYCFDVSRKGSYPFVIIFYTLFVGCKSIAMGPNCWQMNFCMKIISSYSLKVSDLNSSHSRSYLYSNHLRHGQIPTTLYNWTCFARRWMIKNSELEKYHDPH